ncbi:hypothetical protein [Paenibacillus sp. NEAU-GSW1]|uniref:hypothetical protein n=1 Tax=Paenibacillus sp. NEAU-GSW1 TaxID=2682486 RepID=UPI00139E0C08|nr:hypothetical protein [Paenibacillus sp. NEAU-GSW1]MUT65326.1 hypothetical protein [Paenibacillus sp. NEAU-GSW1]
MAQIQNESRTSYVGVGRRQIIEQTFWQVPWWNQIDPLAQTFLLLEERLVTSIELFFETKDVDHAAGTPAEYLAKPVTVQLRNVVNGYPGTTVLASKVVEAKSIQISAKGNLPTKFTFADPVLLQTNVEYAIVVLTGASQYRLFVAKMSAKDLVTGNIVSRQPYAVGLLFSSSNATAWTAHQDMDLKFRLYAAEFKKPVSKIYFEGLTLQSEISQLLLSTSQVVPQGSNLQWQWSLDGTSWFALNDSGVTGLGAPTKEVFVRALLSGSAKSSPVIQTEAIGAAALSYKTNGTYVSREWTTNDPFTKIIVYVDLYKPAGTSQSVEFSIDGGSTWVSLGAGKVNQPMGQYAQYKFEATVAASKKIRIRIKQSNDDKSRAETPRARRLMVTLS